MPADTDQHWMQRALAQAQQSAGLASPNPSVGCVLVQGDRVVGEGFHQYDRRDHAEIVALKQAGEQARGATAYVTLEPCSHHGRTGPCADALINAGIGRVVFATHDPNPLVRGQGAARLNTAGVEVLSGVLEQQARRLNDGFARSITTSRPFVTIKVASSLDGRIAPAPGSQDCNRWITGDAARAEVHRMRHAVDALLVGVGTVLADDPLLTDRSGLPRRRPLLRIVLDSTLRTPLTSQLVTTAHDDVLIFFTEASQHQQTAFRERGVRLHQIPHRLPLADVLLHLGTMQLTSLLLEGGQALYTAALEQGIVDRLVLFLAPCLMGQQAIPMLGPLDQRLVLPHYDLKTYGDDVALDTLLHDPWVF